MFDLIKLNFSPFSADSIAWSHDGELAVAGPDTLQLHVPKSIARDSDSESRDSTGNQWDTIRFRTNDFTQDELPEKEIVSFEGSSIGEEQSAQYNSAIAWSPLGLSRHGRCALGLLSTGHILSIWAARGNVVDEDGWERVLVINNILAAHNVDDHRIHGVDEQDTEGIRQLRNRVRSFTWASSLRISSESLQGSTGDDHWPSKPKEVILLAVANEYNEVILLQISSSFIGRVSDEDSWTAKILLWEPIAEPPIYARLQGPKATLNRPWRYVRKLNLSPWSSEGQETRALLAYISNGSVRIRQLSIKNVHTESPTFKMKPTLSDEEITPYIGELASQDWFDSLAWDDKIRNGSWTFAFSNADVVGVATIPTTLEVASKTDGTLVDLQSIGQVTVQLLPQSREERICCITFDRAPVSKEAHLHMSTSQYETKSVIRVQRRRAAEFVESSRWQTLIEDQREEFDEEHRLAGNVLVKFHGLAASPIGGLVAACFSLHPSDRLDYLLPHRDSSIIIFDDEYLDLSAWFPTSTDKETVPDESELSTELFCQTVQRISKLSGDEVDSGEAASSRINSLKALRTQLLSFNEPKGVNLSEHFSTGSIKSQKIRAKQLFHILDLLDSKDLPGPAQEDLEDTLYRSFNSSLLPQYLDFVFTYSFESIRSSKPSQKILYIAARIEAFGLSNYISNKPGIKSALHAFRWLSDNLEMDLRRVIEVCRRKLETEEDWEELEMDEEGSVPAQLCYERCEICDALVYLESLEDATCANGHSFVRCSLTYVAIQSPGISKYCRVCGRGYLDDSLLATEIQQSPRVIDSQSHTTSRESTTYVEDEVILASFGQSSPEQSPTQQDGWQILKKKDANEAQINQTPSLAEAIFTVFSTCPFCGGKFIS